MPLLRSFFLLCAGLLLGTQSTHAMPLDLADKVEVLMPAVVNISTTQKREERAPTRRRGGSPYGGGFPPGYGDPFEDMDRLFEDFFGPGFGMRRERFYRPQSFEHPTEQPSALLQHVQREGATSLGSGFIIAAEGYVVTNHHVVDQADEITVTLQDDAQYTAKLLGSDPKTDLALLKIERDKPFPYVKFGDSDTSRVGDWIIAIGNPFGLGGTVTTGIISARARDINAGPFDDFIQTDAAINRGNSGGPMFNLNGEVIGVNTAIYSPSGGSVGIGFAIPSAIVEPVIQQLRSNGSVTRGWLGVKIQHVTDEIAESVGLEKARGALVTEVLENSPAEKAGIKVGDVILSYDGRDVKVMKKLPRFVAETGVDKRVNVEVWRNSATQSLEVKIARLEEETASNDNTDENTAPEEEEAAPHILGMQLAPLNESLRKRYGIDSATKGLLVQSLDPSSPALKSGVRPGDVVLEMNQRPTVSLAEADEAVLAAQDKGKRSILLLISRDGDTLFLAASLEEETKTDE